MSLETFTSIEDVAYGLFKLVARAEDVNLEVVHPNGTNYLLEAYGECLYAILKIDTAISLGTASTAFTMLKQLFVFDGKDDTESGFGTRKYILGTYSDCVKRIYETQQNASS